MSSSNQPSKTLGLAVGSGASSGMGYNLGQMLCRGRLRLIVPGPAVGRSRLRRALGATVDAVQTDLSSTSGVDELYAAIGGCWRMRATDWAFTV
jgi:NAD(P)-dependent dehydrogenase (short-subunit alcohol dehydrogenase family)